MTRRERLEAKVAKREEWAAKAAQRSDAAFRSARGLSDHIPLGQPILVGHHSEKRHRRDLARIQSRMSRGVEESQLASHHTSKAAGLADQLDRTIFSDDDNAFEAIEARIAEREEERTRCKAINAAFRKATGDKAARLIALVANGLLTEAEAQSHAKTFALMPYYGVPFPPYHLSNLGGRITADKKRLADIRARQTRTARAEANDGMLIEGTDYVGITFAEKPERAVLDALKAAGFHWSGGRWCGYRSRIPACLTQPSTEEKTA